MVGVSVVQYKMNILQQSTKTNNQQRDVLIIRKPSQVVAQSKECTEDVLNARRKAKCGKETPNPPPIAVARRNARERNRVKQVNNGFANLRQHIPNSIAASFESNSGRGGNKKLSKVETLRMAVEYIRSLEDILASNDNDVCETISSSSNFISYPSPSTPSSPALTTSTNLSYNFPLKSPLDDDDDDISTNSTSPSPQYIRIDNGNAYQIIDPHLYENSENLEPIGEHLVADPSIIHADLEFGDVQDLSLLNSIHSPDIYSESSCSPGLNDKSGAQTFVPMIHSRDGTPPSDDVKFEPVDVKDIVHPVISLHTTMQISQDHKENMLHVMAWWEQQQQNSSS